jgi:hypothetical protein
MLSDMVGEERAAQACINFSSSCFPVAKIKKWDLSMHHALVGKAPTSVHLRERISRRISNQISSLLIVTSMPGHTFGFRVLSLSSESDRIERKARLNEEYGDDGFEERSVLWRVYKWRLALTQARIMHDTT